LLLEEGAVCFWSLLFGGGATLLHSRLFMVPSMESYQFAILITETRVQNGIKRFYILES
jgi:hypothetical protein